jgi:protein-tyrosine phosphatase
VIDLHTHILPGIDDGARTLEDALDMARAFVGEGVTAVAATPHVRDDYPTSAAEMLQAVSSLQRVLDREGIPLVLLPGAEVAVEWIMRLEARELRRLTLAGNGRYVLVETPYHGWPAAVVEGLLRLQTAGFTPVLAHPERNPIVQKTPSLLAPLVDSGLLVQVTAASLDGRLGKAAHRTGHRLVTSELAHVVASDAHAPHVRAAGLLSAVDAIGDEALAQWLVDDVPLALVYGQGVPPRPRSG